MKILPTKIFGIAKRGYVTKKLLAQAKQPLITQTKIKSNNSVAKTKKMSGACNGTGCGCGGCDFYDITR